MTVGIIEDEESVYRLIPTVEAAVEKQPMHRSRHNPNVPPSYSTFGTAGTSKKLGNPSGTEAEFDASGGHHKAKKNCGSIGANVGGTIQPGDFLKKGGPRVLPEPKKFERKMQTERKQKVPAQLEKPVMGLVTEKNFVVANAVDNILAPPKKQTAAEQPMTQKKDYGAVPSYLRKIKSEVGKEASRKAVDATKQEPLDQKLCLLSADEKRNLIDSLRTKWEQLNKSYQSLTFSMDTVTKVGRKEMQEVELEKLERAMNKLQGKKCIFVYDDLGNGFSSLGIKGCDPKLASTL